MRPKTLFLPLSQTLKSFLQFKIVKVCTLLQIISLEPNTGLHFADDSLKTNNNDEVSLLFDLGVPMLGYYSKPPSIS